MKAQLKSVLLFSCILFFSGNAAMAAPCNCPDNIGSKSGTAPIMQTTGVGSSPGLMLCGSLDFLLDDSTALASNFEIFPCGSDSSLIYFDDIHICKVAASGNMLRITEYGRGPVGQDWQWIDFPISEYTLSADLSRPVEQKVVLKFHPMTASEITDALSQYNQAVEAGFVANYETGRESAAILGGIWTAALNGDSTALEALKEIWETLEFDETILDAYANLCGAYNAYARMKGMALLPEEE